MNQVSFTAHQLKMTLQNNYSIVLLDNVKALYRRAKAHTSVWNTDNAKEDYQKCAILDTSLASAVNKELKLLADAVRQKDLEDKVKYQNIF